MSARTRHTPSRLRIALTFWLSVGLAFAAERLPAAGQADESAPSDRAMRQQVNALLRAAWKDASVKPAPPATDAEFLRRASLDLTGRIPTVSEVRAFLDEQSPDKRERLIETLLDSPAHSSHLADVWRQILLPDMAEATELGTSDSLEKSLRSAFAENRPYAEIVRELLLATGKPNDSGGALFYTALELKPEKIAASTSRAFLGIQLQCAECHNHPFDKWTQRDFWGYAAFFARLSTDSKRAMPVSFVSESAEGDVILPNTKEIMRPRYLLGAAASDSAGRTRRALLADWMTSPSNPYFARSAVNRFWALLFGRGLIDPPDDMRALSGTPLAPLLDELAAYFVHTNYDVRRLLRVLATTEAYQLASDGRSPSERPPELFAAMGIKVLNAEQLYACLTVAAGRPYDNVLATVPSTRARRALTNRMAFVNSFRAPVGSPTEYLTGMPQALMLLNGKIVDDATDPERSDVLASLDAPFLTDRDRIETLFLATLSRPPSNEMREKLIAHVAAQRSPEAKRRALGNILWALMNSAEFAVNH
jgi:Protein of unknown function (DUF1549)/Protein of unknown function (DUF1553)